MDVYFDKLKERIQRSVFVSDDLWNELRTKGTLINIKKNENLVMSGSKNRNVFFIASGGLMHSVVSESGYSQAVWFFFDDFFDFSTSLDSFFLNEPTKYSISALEDSVVIKFSKQTIDHLIQEYQTFNEFFMTNITLDFVMIYEFKSYSLVNTPLDTMKYLKSNYPHMTKRVSSKNMAHFLGISPEWYSKLKKKLETE